ncbi:MAG TPA: hypothetical protein ENN41_01945 [Sediminispirochaeta sp.]|nr:hypothetical protein [Sediminispirochaeta sp.]
MKIFGRLKLGYILMLILALPIAGLVFFAGSGLSERASRVAEMERLRELAGLSVRISELVHETQKERGATSGYLGSGGRDFRQTLGEQRRLTDRRLEELRRALDGFDLSAEGGTMAVKVRSAMAALEDLQSLRSRVDDLSAGANEAIGYYTDIDTDFLDAVAALGSISEEGRIVGAASAYVSFLLAKERSGIERAVLSNTFAADGFADGMYRRFISLLSAQESYLDVFANFATEQQMSFYRQKMSAPEVNEVARMEEVAASSAESGDFGVDASYWFDTMTAKINLLKEVEDHLSADLEALSDQLQSAAMGDLLLFLSITVGVLLLTAFISTVGAREILTQLGGEPSEMEKIARRVAQGELNIEEEGRNGKKKITGVFQSLMDMVESLRQKADVLEKIAGKDLRVEVVKASEGDRLGDSMLEMKTSLNEILLQVDEAVDQVSNGADQIAQSSQALAQGATEQASSLEEVSSSVNEINSQAKQNADNAGEANGIARSVSESTSVGVKQMQELQEAMGEINSSSEEIRKVVKIIDDISFQINLLALNANVEAARAGKYGKGFAVVADEVRNLAVKSAESVKETNRMVEDTLKGIGRGNEAVEKTNAQLQEIVEGVEKVSTFLEEIAHSSGEQSQAIDQITDALEQIDQATQGNTASAEESASASEELSGQAQELRRIVQLFALDRAANRREAEERIALEDGRANW